MASFIIKVCSFILLALILTGALITFTWKPYFKGKNVTLKKNILAKQAPTLKNYVLVLGNSHAHCAFNTAKMNQQGINMAAPSQGMMEDYAILKQAFQLNPSISKVALVYSYHSNANILHLSTRDEEVIRMFEYANTYAIKYPNGAITPKKCLSLLSNWGIYITKRPGSRNDLDPYGNQNNACKSETFKITGASERVEQHFNQRSIISNKPNIYFDSIRNFCLSHGIPLTVIITPYTKAYTNELKRQQPEAYSFLNTFAITNSSSYKLLDCRNLFIEQEDYFFKDVDHLSPCGRDSFSTYIQNLL